MKRVSPSRRSTPHCEQRLNFILPTFRLGTGLFLALILSGCAGLTTSAEAPSALDPRGPAAASIANLWWVMFGLGTAVFVIVMGALAYALLRSRDGETGQHTEGRSRTAVLSGGFIIPAIILVVLFGFTLGTLRATAMPQTDETMLIEVVGRRWWWEVHYPHQQITTANEIHIPVGQPVQIKLTSDEVIHSFWVPQLHGKMDTNPGRVNTFWLQADQAGEYWGECAEFCGVQHANMRFVVVAEPAEQFAGWLEAQSQPAAASADDLTRQGEAVFLGSGCMNCHAIEGTHATGELGPDLTHFASRLTLASGAAPNTRGNLGGWVADPHSIKPGNLMPPTDLTGDDLNALLAYLESLK